MNKSYLLFLLLVFCTGCAHHYYAPNMHNVPLFRDKNEVRVVGAASVGDEVSGIEGQAAYSITNHIAVMANFISATGGNNNTKEDYGKGMLIEAGAGYFMHLADMLVLEAYGGYGMGNVQNGYRNDYFSGRSDMKLSRFFIQPQVGITSGIFDFAFSARVSRLNYSIISYTVYSYYPPNPLSITDQMEDLDKVSYLQRNPSHILLEPAFTARLGWKYVGARTSCFYSK